MGLVWARIRPKYRIAHSGGGRRPLRGEIAPGSVFGVLEYVTGRGIASYPAKLMDLGGITMMTERYEEGMRIISVETEEEFLEAMGQMTNYRVAIEAPESIMEALAIDSAEELGIEPDDLGLPAEAYERGRWN